MDVVFMTSDGRRLPMEIYYYDTVLQMKRSIERIHGIPVAQQRLLVGDDGDEAMEDDRDTDYYGIVTGSCIRLHVLDNNGTGGGDQDPAAAPPEFARGFRLERPPSGPITVTVRPRSSNLQATVSVKPLDDVVVLKAKLKGVSDQLGISDDYVLVFEDKIMDERLSFWLQGVKDGDVIDLV